MSTELREAPTSTQPGKICNSRLCAPVPQPLGNFRLQTKGQHAGQLSDRCQKCMASEAAKRKRKRDAEKKEKIQTEWPEIDIKTFFENLSLGRDIDIEFQVTIETKELMAVELPSKERGNRIAKLIDDAMEVHWTYRTVSVSAGHAHYVYTCSQDIEKEKRAKASAEKQKEKNHLPIKTRDRRTMDRGNCTGVLRFF